MFGRETKDRIYKIENVLLHELRKKDDQIDDLQRDLKNTRSWGEKWRAKAKFLRKVRKQLTEKTS